MVDSIRFDWTLLSSDDFEKICVDILDRDGLKNINRMSGPGGGDLGRDILAEEFIELSIGMNILKEYMIQCKNYYGSKSSIGPKVIEEYALRAETFNKDILLIITSYDFTSNAKDIAEKISKDKSRRVKIYLWTESDLISKLLEYEDVRNKYFNKTEYKSDEIKIPGYISREGHLIFHCMIKIGEEGVYKPTTFLLDTGATISTIMGKNIELLGIQNIGGKKVSEIMTISGQGRLYIQPNISIMFMTDQGQAFHYSLKEIGLLPTLENMPNLLGMDVLRNSTIAYLPEEDKGFLIFRNHTQLSS